MQQEESSEVRAEVGEEDGSREVLSGSADATWVEFEGVGGIFAEGQEVIGIGNSGSRFRNGAGVDEGKNIDEGGKIGAVRMGRAVWGVVMGPLSGEGMEEVESVKRPAVVQKQEWAQRTREG